MPDTPLVVIVGPTASGKTVLSLSLAQHFHGEIVNCDSVAVYREFEIGTAKPSRQERALVPHHLLDIANPGDPFTAGDYARLARQALSEITSRGNLPIVVGGTGLYLRALLDGLFEGPPRSEELRERLRQRATDRGPGYLHRLLRRLDHSAAEKIHPNDDAKIIRALEVRLVTGAPMTELWKQGRDPLQGFRILRIGLNPDRTALYERIDDRAAAMFDHGLIDEADALGRKHEHLGPSSPLGSLGYKQAVQLLTGEIDLAEAIRLAQQGHRNYAKRQMTWFRREPRVHWIDDFGDSLSAQSRAQSLVSNFLAGHSVQ
jgi:tRNA dimethylallyltransferase